MDIETGQTKVEKVWAPMTAVRHLTRWLWRDRLLVRVTWEWGKSSVKK